MGMGRPTPQLGTAIRAAVQFFAPVGRGGGAVNVCAVARAALKSRESDNENFIVEMQASKLKSFFFATTHF